MIQRLFQTQRYYFTKLKVNVKREQLFEFDNDFSNKDKMSEKDLNYDYNYKIPQDQEDDYEQYKRRLMKKQYLSHIQKKLQGIKDSLPPPPVEDYCFGFDIPKRLYYKPTLKELYYIPRHQNMSQRYIDKLGYMDYLVRKEYEVPEEIRICINKIKEIHHDDGIQKIDLENFIEAKYFSNKKTISLFKQIQDKLSYVNFKQLPNIALAIAFELNYLIEKGQTIVIWKILNENFEKNIHKYDSIELAQINYALIGKFPKRGSVQLREQIISLIKEDLNNYGSFELANLLLSFQNLLQFKSHFQQLLLNKLYEKVQKISDPQQLCHIFNIISQYKRNKSILLKMKRFDLYEKSFKKVADLLYNKVYDSIDQLSFKDRMVVLDSLIQLDHRVCDDMLMQSIMMFEEDLKSDVSIKDRIEIASQVYQLGKYTFNTIQFCQKFTEGIKYTDLEFQRDQITLLQIHSKQTQIIKEYTLAHCNMLDYKELKALTILLIQNDVTDKEIWREVVLNISKQLYVYPIPLYPHFKALRFYLQKLFPDWNLKPLVEAGLSAEFKFEIEQYIDFENKNLKYFYNFLQEEAFISTIPNLEWENTFQIDFAIMPQKLAIILKTKENTDKQSKQMSFVIQLKIKVLEQYGWKVVLVNFEEFKKQQDRSEYIRGVVMEANNQQIEVYNSLKMEREIEDKIRRQKEREVDPIQFEDERDLEEAMELDEPDRIREEEQKKMLQY